MAVDNNPNIPDILSITQMARLLCLSRSRFYQLMSENIFLPPIYSASNKRPYFTSEMAEQNMAVKKNNVGVNGKIVLFYSSRNNSILPTHRKKSGKNKSINNIVEDTHKDVKEGLCALGLSGVSNAQIESTLASCFPGGTGGTPEGEILRAVFLSIKRQNSTDNQDR